MASVLLSDPNELTGTVSLYNYDDTIHGLRRLGMRTGNFVEMGMEIKLWGRGDEWGKVRVTGWRGEKLVEIGRCGKYILPCRSLI